MQLLNYSFLLVLIWWMKNCFLHTHIQSLKLCGSSYKGRWGRLSESSKLHMHVCVCGFAVFHTGGTSMIVILGKVNHALTSS